MDNKRRIKGMTLGNLALFALAAVLLISGSIGSARAALVYFSQTYTSRVETQKIGVTLVENDNFIAWRNYDEEVEDGYWDTTKRDVNERLFQNMLGEDESFVMGKAYDEELAVYNSGTIDQYVRVNVYRYWVRVDENGNETKLRDLSPKLIDLNLINTDHWHIDEQSNTDERFVLYYDSILKVGETSLPFSDTITVNGMTADHVTQTKSEQDGYTVITTTYDYNGVEFRLEVEVNAIQDRNAQDAIGSTWGREVQISSNDKLSLKNEETR